jgi:flagellar motor protein MotB
MTMSRLLCTLSIALVFQACVSSSSYKATVAHVESLKADSALLAKRNRMLTEDKSYLETKSANMEQLLNQRLQEKEDSLNHKGELLKQREASINDMKARKAEEREAFETLSKSVFELFNTYAPTDIHRYTNCTQINVEVSDRLLFIPGSIKIDPKSSQLLASVAEALAKNPDLNLIIIAHTDSLAGVKEKYDDNWTLGSMKANLLVRALIREQKIAHSRVFSASKAETIALAKANSAIGRNRVEFVFYSSFLPCIHSKEE